MITCVAIHLFHRLSNVPIRLDRKSSQLVSLRMIFIKIANAITTCSGERSGLLVLAACHSLAELKPASGIAGVQLTTATLLNCGPQCGPETSPLMIRRPV